MSLRSPSGTATATTSTVTGNRRRTGLTLVTRIHRKLIWPSPRAARTASSVRYEPSPTRATAAANSCRRHLGTSSIRYTPTPSLVNTPRLASFPTSGAGTPALLALSNVTMPRDRIPTHATPVYASRSPSRLLANHRSVAALTSCGNVPSGKGAASDAGQPYSVANRPHSAPCVPQASTLIPPRGLVFLHGRRLRPDRLSLTASPVWSSMSANSTNRAAVPTPHHREDLKWTQTSSTLLYRL